MIIYSAYLFLLSIFFMSTSWMLAPVFDGVGIPTGIRSLAIQAAALGLCVVMLVSRRVRGLVNETAWSVAVWVPWLVYAALRTDFSDASVSLYFWKLIVVQFISVVTVTVAYRSSPNEFDKYFPWIVILLGLILITRMLSDPAIFVYASVIERLTVEDANPIWLARSFAAAAVCVLFLPIRNHWVKIVAICTFAAAIIPTGSRSPLVALILVLCLYAAEKSWYRSPSMNRVVLIAIGLTIAAFATWPHIEPFVTDYLSRGTALDALSESGRPELFRQAFREFLSSPFVGIGIGEFGRSGALAVSAVAENSYPHNIFFEILSGTGLVGVVLFGLTFRFGQWVSSPTSLYYFLFILSLVMSMTSGDLNANNGVVIFAALARLAYSPARRQTTPLPRPAIKWV